jgi:hypothetical protein
MFCGLVWGAVSTVYAPQVLAYSIETMADTPVEKDIVLGPGKAELSLDPGESATTTLYFTNRTGRTIDFTVNVEDFMGSKDPQEGTVFLGDQKSPYTLKDYLNPEVWQFTLEHGQRISLPVTVAVPIDAEPGGRYGVVFATAAPPKIDGNASYSGPVVGIASRVGSLFFIRVKGEANESGSLKSFSAIDNQIFFEKGPITLRAIYENSGNVYLNPYGSVEIKNIFGKTAGDIKIDPYFAMPNAQRMKEVTWKRDYLFGMYTAEINLNRGYGDIVDTKSFVFYILPWKILVAGFVGLALVIWFFVWVFSHFEFKKKN